MTFLCAVQGYCTIFATFIGVNMYPMKKQTLLSLIAGAALLTSSLVPAAACTGIALTAKDGSYIQSRTIEWSEGPLVSQYVIIPRGQALRSMTPTGQNGLQYTAKYGVVGLAVVQKEFIAEGINEAGLSAGAVSYTHIRAHE